MKKVMMVFSEGGQNGGPYVSHKRIIESELKNKYKFVSLYIPKGRLLLFNFKLTKYLISEIRKETPDIIQIPGLQLQGFHVMLASFISKVKKRIIVIHGSSMESTSLPKWKKIILYFLEKITLMLSTDIYCVSNYVSNWKRLEKYSKKNHGTIYNLPSEQKQNNIKNIREKLKIDRDKIVFTCTGRITKEKGFDVLLGVIKKINNEKVCFVIAGDGDFLQTMRNELKSEIKNNKVYLLGYRSDIMEILSSSDAFIICTHHETLCISLIEAAQMGLPLLGTNVGGIPEIIIDGYNGYLTKNYSIDDNVEKINSLISDRKNMKELGKNAKKHIDEMFDRKKILDKIDYVYKR